MSQTKDNGAGSAGEASLHEADPLAVLRQFLADRLDVESEKVVPEAVLQDLGVDSLMFAEMLFELEDRLHMTIDLPSGAPIPRTMTELLVEVENLRAKLPAPAASAKS